MNRLFGHQAIETQLKQAFDSGHLHHALILSGIDGVGKETLAYRLISYALAPSESRQPDDLAVPKNVRENGHPNVFVIKPVFDEKKQRYKREITLAALSGLTKFLRLMPQSDAPRFIVIKPAEIMNIETQNALLKMLEEPPARTHFLLLTSQVGSLLPTIRSRCLTLALAPLSVDEFANGIDAILPHVDAHHVPVLYRLSSGALGQAVENEKLALPENYGRFCGAAVNWHDENNSRPAMQLAEELTRTGNENLADKVMETISSRLAQFVRNDVTGVSGDDIAPEEQRLKNIWRQMPMPRLLNLHDALLAKWRHADEAYMDKKIVLLGLFGGLSGMDS